MTTNSTPTHPPTETVSDRRSILVLVTPERSAVDEFIHHNYPGISVRDVLWIKNTNDLYKVRGFELDWEGVHFLYRSYEIENAREEIMARVRNYPVKEDL